MSEWEKEATTSAAFIGSGDDGEICLADVYKHFGYVEENYMFHYEDDGFPTGQYTTEFDDGPNVLRRMLCILNDLRTDRKIRIVIDCDPDFPVAMMRYWGKYQPELEAKLGCLNAE